MKHLRIDKRTTASVYEPDSGDGARETFLFLDPDIDADIPTALADLHERLPKAMAKLGLGLAHLIRTRVYLSDIANQKTHLLNSALWKEISAGSISVMEQTPLDGRRIRLLHYFVDRQGQALPKTVRRAGPDAWTSEVHVQGLGHDLLFVGNLIGTPSLDSYKQTHEIFTEYQSRLAAHKHTLLGNAIRSWIYVRDIDNHYQGMVDARREYFDREGLTAETRYLASTGIEGKSKEVNNLVTMDALSFGNLDPKQIVRMEALHALCPTHVYKVTFERGLKVSFGDRDHMYLSGTASIDSQGDVVHIGDAVLQTRRTLENIKALLKPHGFDFNDLAYLLIYLRDTASMKEVLTVVKNTVGPDLPLLVVKGTVCRPTWLVEMEAIGILQGKQAFPAFL